MLHNKKIHGLVFAPLGIGLLTFTKSVIDKVSNELVDNYWDSTIQTIFDIAQFVDSALSTSYKFSLYQIVSAILILAILFVIYKCCIKCFLDSRKAKSKTFRDYTETTINNILWKWEWELWGNNLEELRAYCPKCQGEIIPVVAHTGFPPTFSLQCLCCGTKVETYEMDPQRTLNKNDEWDYIQFIVQKEIERRVRAKDFI